MEDLCEFIESNVDWDAALCTDENHAYRNLVDKLRMDGHKSCEYIMATSARCVRLRSTLHMVRIDSVIRTRRRTRFDLKVVVERLRIRHAARSVICTMNRTTVLVVLYYKYKRMFTMRRVAPCGRLLDKAHFSLTFFMGKRLYDTFCTMTGAVLFRLYF